MYFMDLGDPSTRSTSIKLTKDHSIKISKISIERELHSLPRWQCPTNRPNKMQTIRCMIATSRNNFIWRKNKLVVEVQRQAFQRRTQYITSLLLLVNMLQQMQQCIMLYGYIDRRQHVQKGRKRDREKQQTAICTSRETEKERKRERRVWTREKKTGMADKQTKTEKVETPLD